MSYEPSMCLSCVAEVTAQYSMEFDNPINYVVTFSLQNTVPRPAFLNNLHGKTLRGCHIYNFKCSLHYHIIYIKTLI